MKKLFLLSVTVFAFVFSSHAQDIADNAIGLRLGDSDGLGAEVSYQRALGDNNRLEIDLGWRDGTNYDGFKLAGLYQWVWGLDGGFNWYAGAGGGLGSWSHNQNNLNDNGVFIVATGDIGIEYNFQQAPIQLSLDYRPEFYINSDNYRKDNYGSDIALSVRYRFN